MVSAFGGRRLAVSEAGTHGELRGEEVCRAVYSLLGGEQA